VPHLATAAEAHEPNALETTVAELSAQPVLAVTDYARLAQQTVDFASQPSAPGGSTRTGVIDDALTAVNVGEAADAHAADWPALRKQLEQLKQAQQQQQEQPKPQQGQQQQQQSGGGQQQDKQDQQNAQQGGSESQKDSQGQQSQNGQSGEQPGKEQQQSKSTAQPNSDQQGENDKAARNGDSNGKADDKEQKAGQPGKEDSHDAGKQREVAENKEQKPLVAPDAGLGKLDAEKPEHDAAQDKPASQPATRMVGGGRVREDVPPNGDPALAAAVGKMERVKDGDAPAVLFERMSQADHPKPPRKTGKNW
ncbi:MAG: hypothetical protein ACRDL7_10695, partial [Gaiellaceae bacterium]